MINSVLLFITVQYISFPWLFAVHYNVKEQQLQQTEQQLNSWAAEMINISWHSLLSSL